jgi:two-component system chemotaxis response regulator CheV
MANDDRKQRLDEEARKQEILLESGTNEVEIAEFLVGEHHCGLNVAKVQQIIEYDPEKVTRIPEDHPALVGTILFRGSSIPLIDLQQALWGKPTGPEHSRLVLVTHFSGATTAFVITGADRIHRIEWTRFEPISGFLSATSSMVTGTITIDKRDILILDIEHITGKVLPSVSETDAEEREAFQEQEKEKQERDEAPDRSSVRILYAEDSPTVRKMTVHKLAQMGYSNLEAVENGQLAHDRIVELQERAEAEGKPLTDYLDVLLTDIEMPQLDGLTLCRRVKEQLGIKDVPVVIYSSLVSRELEHKCEEVGADAYLHKPKVETIVAKLDEMMF